MTCGACGPVLGRCPVPNHHDAPARDRYRTPLTAQPRTEPRCLEAPGSHDLRRPGGAATMAAVTEPPVDPSRADRRPSEPAVRDAVDGLEPGRSSAGTPAAAARRRGRAADRGRAARRPGARRLRDEPRDEAGPAVSDGAARDRDGARRCAAAKLAAPGRPTPPIAAAESARPGSSTCASPIDALERRRRRDPRATRRLGPRRRLAAPRVVNVEFVSANPTGPLHIGNARGAFVGDLLCRVLEAGGQRVTREYYFNDSGGQIRNLGASVVALRRGEPVPEDGYKGDYVADLAAALPDDVWAEATRRRRRHGRDRRATGRPAASARGSRRASRRSASTSTSGRARPGSTTRAGSTGRSSGCASAATSTSRTARSGSARPTSATTRTG